MTGKGVQVREVKGKGIKRGCRATFSFETKQVLLVQRSVRKGTVRVPTPRACSSRNHCCMLLYLCIQCTRPLSHKKLTTVTQQISLEQLCDGDPLANNAETPGHRHQPLFPQLSSSQVICGADFDGQRREEKAGRQSPGLQYQRLPSTFQQAS